MQTAAYPAAIERHEINAIPVWRFLPPGVASQGEANAPHVFVLHGLNSRKERHLHFCLELVANGLAAVALDARSHGERFDAATTALHGSRDGFEFLVAFAGVVDGTVADVQTVADSFGLTDYGLWGHSMGGYIATRTALDDRRASVIVNLSGSLDVAGFGIPDVPPLSDMIRRADIIARASELSPRPYLLLHGALDELVPTSGARRLHGALSLAYARENASDHLQYLEYPTLGHDYTPEVREESVQFLRRYLGKNQ